MDSATEKQVLTLKKFARNPELSREILRGVQFDTLSKKEASELITKCFGRNNTPAQPDDEREMGYSQNFKDNYGKFRTATLTGEELEALRETHRKHCQQILQECEEDYPEEPELILAVFDKRCDKIYTWIQLALDIKVRKERLAQRAKFYPANELVE